MNDEPEVPEEPSDKDLQSLMGDFDLTPDWAKGTPGVTQSHPPRSGDSRDRGRRPSFKKGKSSRDSRAGVRVKPRRDHGGGSGRDRDDRGGQGRSSSRGRHSGHGPRMPRLPVHVDFIPDKTRLSKVVKVIRHSQRAYPLHVLAEKFLENPGHLSIKFTVKSKQESARDYQLSVCTANGMVFSDPAVCEAYVVDHGIDALYETEKKEVPPPSGNFVCVGRHRRSGVLLGPPNWHGYQIALEALRKERAPRTSPEEFAGEVEMVRDPEVIEKWKKQVSTQTFYRLKKEELPAEDKPKETAPEPTASSAESAESPEPEAESAATSAEDQPSPETGEPAETKEEASADSEPPEQTGEPPEPEQPVAEEAEEQAEEADDRPFDLTREQVEAEFREHMLPKFIRKAKRAIMPGILMEKMEDPALGELTRILLERERNRPNTIVFALRPAFKHLRLHLFRVEGELVVSGVAPHPLPPDQKIVPELQALIDHVAAHPGCLSLEALKAVSGQEEPPPEFVSHIRWLLEKGHVVELHDTSLHLPPDYRAP